jgi:hypothetical protein
MQRCTIKYKTKLPNTILLKTILHHKTHPENNTTVTVTLTISSVKWYPVFPLLPGFGKARVGAGEKSYHKEVEGEADREREREREGGREAE